VIINQGSKRLLSDGPSSDPSASVSIKMESGKAPGKGLVMGVADLVAGAVDRLARERVNIVVNGASYKIPSEESPFSGDALEARREYERYFSEKIQQSLGIGNALVGVFVEMETEAVKTESKKYGEPQVIREMNKEDTSEQRNSSGEPGVRPNTGAVVAGSSSTAGGEKSSKTETETEYTTDRDVTHTVKQNLPGSVKTIRATVNIPYSYFVDIYKQQTGKTEKPKEADLAPIIAAQLKSIQKKVLPIINATDPTFVEVSHYYDVTASEPGVALASSGSVSMPQQVTQYMKPVGLGLLAFCSLIMVLLMLRKASSNVGIANLERQLTTQEPINVLDNESMPIGEAGSSEGVLEGIEVDEGTLRTRKMAEQVSTLVKEDPSGAAALVKQWILRDR
jgi:flagellar biosynthesis/type III secretory pathway M-ring protein FliF/YscJ